MAEYIERDALLRAISEIGGSPLSEWDTAGVVSLVANQPAADVVPVVHGRWIGEGDGYADGELVCDVWHCSECDHCIDDGTDDPEQLPDYCPGCGAKMEVSNDD